MTRSSIAQPLAEQKTDVASWLMRLQRLIGRLQRPDSRLSAPAPRSSAALPRNSVSFLQFFCINWYNILLVSHGGSVKCRAMSLDALEAAAPVAHMPQVSPAPDLGTVGILRAK
ncbi:unnamed protein product [Colias eurytheme]|nr:unnamed protein product [Colias eurytheme]